jgi:hypothetical protein
VFVVGGGRRYALFFKGVPFAAGGAFPHPAGLNGAALGTGELRGEFGHRVRFWLSVGLVLNCAHVNRKARLLDMGQRNGPMNVEVATDGDCEVFN